MNRLQTVLTTLGKVGFLQHTVNWMQFRDHALLMSFNSKKLWSEPVSSLNSKQEVALRGQHRRPPAISGLLAGSLVGHTTSCQVLLQTLKLGFATFKRGPPGSGKVD